MRLYFNTYLLIPLRVYILQTTLLVCRQLNDLAKTENQQ